MTDTYGPGGRPPRDEPVEEVAVLEGGFSKLSWRSVFGGTFTALGVWILLGAFGLAVGFSMVSPEDQSLSGMGTWLGVWSLIVPILALFAGTLVAARASGGIRKLTGMLYGVVVWGMTTVAVTIVGVWLMSSVVGQTLQATTSVVSGVGGAAASVVGAAGVPGDGIGQASQAVGEFLNVEREEILSALNQQLEEEGLPPIEPQQLQAAIQNAANTALQQGTVSTEIFVDALVQETDLSREQVQQTAQQLQQQWDQVVGTIGTQLSNVAGAAGDVALRSLEAMGAVMWWVFASMTLGLLAALGAGMLATNRPTMAVRLPVAPPDLGHRGHRQEEAYAAR